MTYHSDVRVLLDELHDLNELLPHVALPDFNERLLLLRENLHFLGLSNERSYPTSAPHDLRQRCRGGRNEVRGVLGDEVARDVQRFGLWLLAFFFLFRHFG